LTSELSFLLNELETRQKNPEQGKAFFDKQDCFVLLRCARSPRNDELMTIKENL